MSTINERIIEAVTPVVAVCVPDPLVADVGEAPAEYCTFTYSEIPDDFGDNAPGAMRYLVQVHYYPSIVKYRYTSAPRSSYTSILASRAELPAFAIASASSDRSSGRIPMITVLPL